MVSIMFIPNLIKSYLIYVQGMNEGGESSNRAGYLDKTHAAIRKDAGNKLMKVSEGVESMNGEILNAANVTEGHISNLPENESIVGFESFHRINVDGAGTFTQIANEISAV